MLNEEDDQGVEELLDGSQLMFDQNLEIGGYPSSDCTYTNEDNLPLKWMIQRLIIPTSSKGKEKVIEDTPRRRPSSRAVTQKIMGDAMKSNK